MADALEDKGKLYVWSAWCTCKFFSTLH